jgi:hypothetical protein
MPEVEGPTDHDQGQTPTDARDKLRKFVIEVARRSLRVGMVAGILGGLIVEARCGSLGL